MAATILSLWMARTASLAFFVTNTLLLFSYHVRAESGSVGDADGDDSTFWERAYQGPAGLNLRDKVLVAALVTLAFELLDFLCKHSGSKLFLQKFGFGRWLCFRRHVWVCVCAHACVDSFCCSVHLHLMPPIYFIITHRNSMARLKSDSCARKTLGCSHCQRYSVHWFQQKQYGAVHVFLLSLCVQHALRTMGLEGYELDQYTGRLGGLIFGI